LARLAEVITRTGDTETAHRLLEEAWQKGSLIGDRHVLGDILMVNAMLAAGQGETGEAVRLCGEALHYFAELCNRARVAGALHMLAGLLADSGGIAFAGDPAGIQRLRRAAVLSGASASLLRLTGAAQLWPMPQSRTPLSATEARERLGADAYAATYAEGQAISLEAAVAFAESVVRAIAAEAATGGSSAPLLTPRQAARERFGGVTARERAVAELVAQGRSNREIATALVLSERTVETHVTNILNKLGYDSRAQVAAWAVRVGLHS
jgi:non-specific serine/threonine protein kinase